MSKSIKLDIKPNFEFILIAFVSSEPIYRMSWLVNECTGIQLKEAPPLKIYHNKRALIQEFSMFQYKPDEQVVYQLFQNKGVHGLFIEEQKQVDYWLKIEGSALEANEVLKKLKDLKNVSLIFEVKPGSLKSKTRLIFSIEEEV